MPVSIGGFRVYTSFPSSAVKNHLSVLIDAVVKEMKSHKGLALRLYVHQDSTKAIRAYEKIGFAKSPYEMKVRREEQ